jgi:Rhodopirellula transposase DDE domain
MSEDTIRGLFTALEPVLDERLRRLVAAAFAQAVGHGGVTRVARATGLARTTIERGVAELATPPTAPPAAQRTRRPGGGRKRLTAKDPTLARDLEALVEPTTRGDPQSPLRWTCKSLRRLATELAARGHAISPPRVAGLLHALDYSLQANRKTTEGAAHPDRDAQFGHINARCAAFQRRGQPVVSVDCKKKELVGDFKNGGRDWRPELRPARVRVHDFQDADLGKAIPYGVYDVAANAGWVSVGVDHDTADFAVATLRRWWDQMGRATYPHATELLVTADGGGSNSARSRLWKVAVQRFADATGLRVTVCHFPPGTSKWNKIEHRLFCHITANWRGQPLTSLEVIVQLIGHTTTRKGLRVQAALDPGTYPTKQVVTDDQLAAVRLRPARFHGEWNYTISPHPKPS